jgi:uncharacterized SAM-binding protein YcdF (DUF218 family)
MIAGSDFVRYVMSGGGAICCFLIAAIWLTAARDSRTGRRFLLMTALLFTAASLYGPQYLISRAMAWPFKPFDASDVVTGHRTAIVVLGSGSIDAEDWDGRTFSFVDRSAAARVLEAVRVFRMTNAAIVLSSGGNPRPQLDEKPSGETMRDALVQLGVPEDRILMETASKTTRDEAVIVAEILRAQNVDRAILVTSQTHMKRSLGAFRAAGIDAVPAIAQEFERHVPLVLMVVPSEDGLGVASTNVHEALGLAYYWLRGWWRTPAYP